VNARVVREFGVEGRGHDFSLADSDRIITLGGDDFHVLPYALDFRCADENHFSWHAGEEALADGAIDLASVGVAADGDVERAQAYLFGIVDFVGQQNRSRTRTKRGFRADELLELFESGFAEQLEERAGFAAGDDEAVDFVKLLRLLDEHNVSAQLFEPATMGVKVALEGKNTDFHISRSEAFSNEPEAILATTPPPVLDLSGACHCALRARDPVHLGTPDLRPGLQYSAPSELGGGGIDSQVSKTGRNLGHSAKDSIVITDPACITLPTPRLQHLSFIQRAYRQSFHRGGHVFADFK
jgi:hypothetical protein